MNVGEVIIEPSDNIIRAMYTKEAIYAKGADSYYKIVLWGWEDGDETPIETIIACSDDCFKKALSKLLERYVKWNYITEKIEISKE